LNKGLFNGGGEWTTCCCGGHHGGYDGYYDGLTCCYDGGDLQIVLLTFLYI
jgi:hypothetical protein